MAKCCCDLKKYDEAEKTILYKWKLDKKSSSSKAILSVEELIAHFNESASFVSQLLGLICSKTERASRAIEYYRKSLKINPFLWSSFEKLIQLGVKIDSSKIFDISNVDFNMCHGFNPLVNLWNSTDKLNDHHHLASSHKMQQQQNYQNNQNTINALDNQQPADRSLSNLNALNSTPSLLSSMKELNQPFEIRSPFAFIKSTPEMSSIDVITPENNNWVTTACLAPQKFLNNSASTKSGGRQKLPTSQLTKKFSSSLAVDKPSGDQTSRLSFGVFSIGGAETPPLSNLAIPNMILDYDNKSTPSDIMLNMVIATGNTSSNSPLTTSQGSLPGKISRAPIKKPQTRRGQQSAIGLHNPTSRNLTSKLQLVNTVNTQQLLDSNSIYVNSTASTPNQNTTIQSLRRSSRLFNSSSSVKENNTKTTRNMNQENNNKKTLQACSKTPTKRIKMSNNNNSSTSLHKQTNASNPNAADAEYNAADYQKNNEKNLLLSSQAINEDLKAAGLKMQRASAEGLLNLLSALGQAAVSIGQFRCEQAINILQKLPKKHYQSSYVLTAIGRAYFELGRYEDSVTFFEEARRREPHILKGMEYYSTALWHLQREVKLSMLAQELVEYDRNAPQTWCVSGNCFSLQKEHETAIKFLQRAIQIDADFAYAYTLLGHEFVLTEEMDNAMACFRNAIRIDNRHYNAFYGIGMIYYKQEKFKMAEVHYRKALNISPNPVLLCHLAVVQHALKKSDLALQTLNKAIEMDPKNALCKFHRASIKFSMDDYESALSELEELKQIVPKESLVYFLIGKVSVLFGDGCSLIGFSVNIFHQLACNLIFISLLHRSIRNWAIRIRR